MINKVVSAICTAIYAEFGDSYYIHKEQIKQGLVEPCFFVQSINPQSNRTITDRKRKSYQFMVQYFPSSDTPYNEINAVIERLNDALEEITVDGCIIRSNGVQATTNDDVLNYEITYDFFLINVDEQYTMGSYEVENNVHE